MSATRSLWSPPDASEQRHICIVTETYSPEVNGVAMTLSHLVKGLRRQGHAVSVVRPRRQSSDRSSDDGDLKVTVVPGLPIPGYKGVHVGMPGRGLLQGRWTQHRPDVVYVATEGPLGWVAVRTAQRLRIPVLSGFHTNFHSYAKHYRLGWLQPLLFHYLCRFHNRTSATLVASVALRDYLQAAGVNNVWVLERGVGHPAVYPRTPLCGTTAHVGCIRERPRCALRGADCAGEKLRARRRGVSRYATVQYLCEMYRCWRRTAACFPAKSPS
jgi:glycosyltransferase involved in cell wall biosynthesis